TRTPPSAATLPHRTARRAANHAPTRASRQPRAPRGPLKKLVLENELANEPLQRCDACLVLRQHFGGGCVAVERTGLVLGNPDPDQVTADVMPLGEAVKRLAGQVVLNNLPLELDRVAAVLGPGAFSSKARPR